MIKYLFILTMLVLLTIFNITSLTAKQLPPYKPGDEIVVLYGASWCPPCKIIKKYIDESDKIQKILSEKFIDQKYWYMPWPEGDTEVDKLSQKWIDLAGVTKIPTLVRFRFIQTKTKCEWVPILSLTDGMMSKNENGILFVNETVVVEFLTKDVSTYTTNTRFEYPRLKSAVKRMFGTIR